MKNIKVLGPGCPKCRMLAANTQEAVKALGTDAKITKVENIDEIIKYGVMVTPALVVDEVVKSSGKVLSVDEVKKIIG
jgi:small redox-active disulfide protein 2